MEKTKRGSAVPVTRMKLRVYKQGKELGFAREAVEGNRCIYSVVFNAKDATAFDCLQIGIVMQAMQKPALVGEKPLPLTFAVVPA